MHHAYIAYHDAHRWLQNDFGKEVEKSRGLEKILDPGRLENGRPPAPATLKSGAKMLVMDKKMESGKVKGKI